MADFCLVEALKKAAGRPSKRRSEDDADEQQAADARPDDAPGAGPAAPAPARNNVVARPAKKAKLAKHVAINQAPTERLHVYVFGENESAELGLGTAKTVIGVKRPRLNPLLAADKVGVVQLAAGAMHVVALTHDNKILTWGVNDLGALGRDTTWDGGLKDLDENDDDSADSDSNADSGLNPNEALPHALPDNTFPEGTIFTQVAAADSSSYAVTDDGLVFGWGTFRVRQITASVRIGTGGR